MEISKEQLQKLMELADSESDINVDSLSSVDISKALVSIERKLNFFNTNINFDSDLSNKNVLIVDDLELSIYQLNQLLKRIGITPSVARNKDEALAELRKKTFNYVLIDLFLPDSKDGFDLISEAVNIRKNNQEDFHIIIMSGTDDKSLIDNCYKLGADSYIAKSAMWHNDILKYISSRSQRTDSQDFSKYTINKDISSYIVKRFNSKKVFDELMADINASILAGQGNIILNLEQINIFDPDNAYFFAEIYKVCAGNKSVFVLVNPSERIKEAISFAYLDGIIPLFNSVESAVDYIVQKNQ